jgi:hypothetical protein
VPLQTEGQTPDGVTIIVDTEMIFSDGTYTGNLTFSSDLGVVVVPVTATMTNVPSKIYIPIVIKG